jgi:hypothetical protein
MATVPDFVEIIDVRSGNTLGEFPTVRAANAAAREIERMAPSRVGFLALVLFDADGDAYETRIHRKRDRQLVPA